MKIRPIQHAIATTIGNGFRRIVTTQDIDFHEIVGIGVSDFCIITVSTQTGDD